MQITVDHTSEPCQVTAENPLAMWKYVLSLLTQRRASPTALSPGDQWKGGLTVIYSFLPCELDTQTTLGPHSSFPCPIRRSAHSHHDIPPTYQRWGATLDSPYILFFQTLISGDSSQVGSEALADTDKLENEHNWGGPSLYQWAALHTTSPANSKLLLSMNRHRFPRRRQRKPIQLRQARKKKALGKNHCLLKRCFAVTSMPVAHLSRTSPRTPPHLSLLLHTIRNCNVAAFTPLFNAGWGCVQDTRCSRQRTAFQARSV